ncbi:MULTISPECIES: hypothetical protein [unclassified Neisseria]|uniref:hypothetical protein n=1 Tax=unclassified Neisseria TaxID=2623750 RepID=UPI001071C4D2|nr:MULTISPECIES: hypothetical protein [unclassified Neisseria]MBF0803325.1 hypothetical protein [Neisseria sp. 19428wB4_WF04]TFU43994.1 hypothetical protein E4T99_02980 [Neisseria sp. WF04]
MNNKRVYLDDFEKTLLAEFLEKHRLEFEELAKQYGLAGVTVTRKLLQKMKGNDHENRSFKTR